MASRRDLRSLVKAARTSSSRNAPRPPLRQSGQVPIYHGGKRTLEPLEISKRPLTPSAGFDLDHVLSFIDSSYVTLWLERAQQNLAMLREWYKDTENVLLFSHFWLSEMPNKDRRDLVELEGDVLLDEFRMALQTGFDGGSVNDEDLISLRRAVFSEYPDIFFSDAGMGCLDLLHILGTDPIHWVQTTEQGTVLNHPYHELLGSVKCTTVNAELRQWLLSLRGFCLVSMLNAIIGFFKNFSVMQVAEGLPRPGTSAGSRHIHQAVNHDSVPQTPSSFSSSTLPGKNHDDSDKQDVRESADLLSKRLKAAVVLGDIRPQIPLCINPKKPLAPIPSSISQVGKNLQASSTQSSQRPARDVLNGCLSSKIASSSLSTCRPSTAGGTRMYIGAVDEAFDAVKLGHTDVLYYYLSRNLVSLSSVDGLGRSLLFLAALHKHEQVVQFLLENKHGIDLNVPALSGNTPLHAAVSSGDARIVQLLVDAGADVCRANEEAGNVLPIDLAKMLGSEDIVRILEKHLLSEDNQDCQSDQHLNNPKHVDHANEQIRPTIASERARMEGRPDIAATLEKLSMHL